MFFAKTFHKTEIFIPTEAYQTQNCVSFREIIKEK